MEETSESASESQEEESANSPSGSVWRSCEANGPDRFG
jgi:hypothetical protein